MGSELSRFQWTDWLSTTPFSLNLLRGAIAERLMNAFAVVEELYGVRMTPYNFNY
jgi:hypothetical protein